MSTQPTEERWIRTIAGMTPGRTQHFVFARYVLGERFMDAFWLAVGADDGRPLTEAEMRHIAAHWHDEELAA